MATMWSGLTTVNALLFAAAISALFAGVPPNPALAYGDGAYAVLWGLTASLHLLAIVVTLILSTAVMSCHDEASYNSVKQYAWVPPNATWLGGAVAYVSLMYSLFHIYGRTAGIVSVVITCSLGFIGGLVSCCVATCASFANAAGGCGGLFNEYDNWAEQEQGIEQDVKTVLDYLQISRQEVRDLLHAAAAKQHGSKSAAAAKQHVKSPADRHPMHYGLTDRLALHLADMIPLDSGAKQGAAAAGGDKSMPASPGAQSGNAVSSVGNGGGGGGAGGNGGTGGGNDGDGGGGGDAVSVVSIVGPVGPDQV